MAYYDNEFLKRYYKSRTGTELSNEYFLHTEIYDCPYLDDSIILEYLDDVHKVLVTVCAERYLDVVFETEEKNKFDI